MGHAPTPPDVTTEMVSTTEALKSAEVEKMMNDIVNEGKKSDAQSGTESGYESDNVTESSPDKMKKLRSSLRKMKTSTLLGGASSGGSARYTSRSKEQRNNDTVRGANKFGTRGGIVPRT